jgi:hypothetical protein
LSGGRAAKLIEDPAEARKLVNEAAADASMAIMERLSHVPDSQRFMLASRAILALFGAHFRAALKMAQRSMAESEFDDEG